MFRLQTLIHMLFFRCSAQTWLGEPPLHCARHFRLPRTSFLNTLSSIKGRIFFRCSYRQNHGITYEAHGDVEGLWTRKSGKETMAAVWLRETPEKHHLRSLRKRKRRAHGPVDCVFSLTSSLFFINSVKELTRSSTPVITFRRLTIFWRSPGPV